ncbi:CoA transferase [Candidatus Aerophobetes bacterium]|uniref:CoA transferase n=1 Tax=Aerophobetes bacterium TaxID=2030807 RepID=A0A662DG20_UNCAE|nr:MAG: CoA transferase [Candidatus Aerophobetes bacterium]
MGQLNHANNQPLRGIRVLDLSRILAGPYCTMMLGDLGAEIIKVEQPRVGDGTRQWGPPFKGGESAYFICINRNKKSITVNLKHPRGIKIIKQLVKKSDVLVENFRYGTMDKLGLDYETLKKINPKLIYCTISAFGTTGPYRELPGYDFLVQAMGGIMSITGEPDGPPMKVGVAIIDVTAALYATSAILAALFYREKTGEGQKVETSLIEAQVAWLINVGSNYLVSGEVPKRYGNAHPNIVPYQVFKVKDGYVALAIGNDLQWKKFCELAGVKELAENPKFETNPKRVENRKELIKILDKLMLEKRGKEWIKLCRDNGIPCGPINTIDKVFNDPQVLNRGMVVEVDHPTAGKIKLAGIPMKFSRTPAFVKSPPPLLGEHTNEVLSNLLGYSKEEILNLRKEQVI